MNPAQALILCADLSRSGCHMSRTHHVCIEQREDLVSVAATNGHLVFRFDFKRSDFPADHWVRAVQGAWSVPGAAFPKWGERLWGVTLDGLSLRCEARTKGGKLCAKQPDPIDLYPGAVILSLWDQVTRQSDPIKVDVSSGRFADCVGILDGDAVVHMQSPDGDGVIVTAGDAVYTRRWRAVVDMTTPPFALRAVRASLLWEALDVCSPVHMLLSATDANAPVIFTSPGHTAIVMPLTL